MHYQTVMHILDQFRQTAIDDSSVLRSLRMQVGIRLAEIALLLLVGQPENSTPSLVLVMNQTTAFRHYNPSDKRYYVQYAPNSTPTPPSPPLSVSPRPPASNNGGQPSRDPKTQPRHIIPAPLVMPAGDSKGSFAGNPGGQTDIKFIPYSPQ